MGSPVTTTRPSKRLQDVHSAAVTLFNEIYAASWPQRSEALAERRFATIPGAQWEGYWGEQFENRPQLEVNMVHLALIRVEDEWRNNRISVTFTDRDGDDDETPNACASLYRADEQDSGAQEAYDNAVQEAMGGGMGAWRLRACYENEYDPDSDRQRIRFEPIYDADQCVFFDLNAKRQDKADARHCFVLTGMTRGAYEEEYGDDVSSWPKPMLAVGRFDWVQADTVYVAEYYRIEDASEKIYTFTDIGGADEKLTLIQLLATVEPVLDADGKEDEEATLQAAITAKSDIGTKLIAQKNVKVRKVHKYVMSGSRVLEDAGYLPGRSIPVFPVFGKRWFVQNVERFMGHVRLAMDSQRLMNMQLSKMAETAARSSDSKPIFDPEQIDPNISQQWADDNLKNYPFLLAKALRNPDGSIATAGPVGMTQPSVVPPVTAALIQIAQGALTELLGSAQAPEELVSNTSGRAVNLTQQRQDARAFVYLDNAAKAQRRCGEVWLEYANELYVEDMRRMKAVAVDGSSSSIMINRPVIGKDGVTSYENDIGNATCDITVDVGPTSSSKRQAMVMALTNVMTVSQDPQQASMLTAMILRNIEGEGLADMHEFERKQLLKMGIGKPTDADKAEAANAQPAAPDPNAQFLMASAAKEASTAQLNAARTQLTMAQTQSELSQPALTKAQTIETLHGVQMNGAATNPAPQSAFRPAGQPGRV